MNKILVSIAMFSLGLVIAQQCTAQITYSQSASKITIIGDNGDNKVNIVPLNHGSPWVSVGLLRGNGVWETRNIYQPPGVNLLIDCDLGRGSNHFWNSTPLRAIIEVNGNGFNSIFCGDGSDVFFSQGNSRDFVFGGGGNDWLDPGDGRDWILGGEGNDALFDGGSLIFNPEGDGDVDWFWGGEGRDICYLGTEDRIEDQEPQDTVYRR